jgi:Double zinc ribbon
VYKDSRRRIEDPWLVAVAVALGIFPPFLGPIIYMFFRPPEYLDDIRERQLEIRAMEESIRPDERCPVCRAGVDSSFLVCPVCTTRLRQACRHCRQPLDPVWQVCPYCATPVDQPTEYTQPL